MNLYIDTSAIIKLFIQEAYSDEIRNLVETAELVATGLITRAETAAGINRLTRMGLLDQEQCEIALSNFRRDWGEYQRIQVTEQIVIRADFLTGQHSLRGYDSVHLACALTWSEMLGAPVLLATFDKELHSAAQKSGLDVFP